jgi:hypothetical protein
MKTAARVFAFGLVAYASCALAQFLVHPDRPNSLREPEIRVIASRLVLGMPEHDAISFLSTNGLRVNATVHGVDGWSYKYCYLDDTPYVHHLSVDFRQKPSPSGFLWATNQYGVRCVVWTNGILHAAILGDVQIARTNAP